MPETIMHFGLAGVRKLCTSAWELTTGILCEYKEIPRNSRMAGCRDKMSICQY